MIARKDLSWVKKKLHHGRKSTGFSVIPSLWRVQYPDGVLSKDHYNLTRAKEHASNEYLSTENNTESGPRMGSTFV